MSWEITGSYAVSRKTKSDEPKQPPRTPLGFSSGPYQNPFQLFILSGRRFSIFLGCHPSTHFLQAMTCSVRSLTTFIVNGIFFNYTFIFKISKRLTLPAAKETCRIPPNSYFYFCNWISRGERKKKKRLRWSKLIEKNATPLTWSKRSPVSFTYQHSALPNFLHFLGTPCYLLDLKSPEKA